MTRNRTYVTKLWANARRKYQETKVTRLIEIGAAYMAMLYRSMKRQRVACTMSAGEAYVNKLTPGRATKAASRQKADVFYERQKPSRARACWVLLLPMSDSGSAVENQQQRISGLAASSCHRH